MNSSFRYKILNLLLSLACLSTVAQNSTKELKGQVSFISSQHIYIKFINTDGINQGDTLYIERNLKLIPALVVTDLSSISCIANAINKMQFTIGNPITAKLQAQLPTPELVVQKSSESVAVVTDVIDQLTTKKSVRKAKPIVGRLSLSSYTNESANNNSYQRFRYAFLLRADSISKTGFSFETYTSFTHRLKKTTTLTDALKIYSLSVKYDTKNVGSVVVGRKINSNLANVGAIDGIQYEKELHNFKLGAVVGTRPDTYTYGFNPTLFQFGAFAAHYAKKGNMQTSIAFMNQTNNSITDRRFAYIQHSNSLLKKLNLFSSFEIDLYTLKNGIPSSTIDLTSTYISLRYKALKNLAFSLSYDARKNIYYYETFKNFADSILDRETRQGLRFQTTYSPFSNLTWGVVAGARFPTGNTTLSTNANTYLSYDNMPLIGGTFQIDFTTLKTYNLNGVIYGGNYSRDIVNNKIYAEFGYKQVKYTYVNSGSLLNQNIAELSLNWRITKKLMLSANYEGIFDNEQKHANRLFINITQRF